MQQNSSVTEFILLGLTQGPLKAENGVCNLLNFLHGYCGREYTHYCDNQVQSDLWESHALLPVLFVLR